MKSNYNKTYNLHMRTCERFGLTIDLVSVPYSCMTEIYNKARGVFRDISVTNAETGEIILNHYESDEIFIATATVGEIIGYIEHILDMAKEMNI
jgi:hypothetical protein